MLIGVSLKLYLDIPATLAWFEAVTARPEVASGRAQLWAAPSVVALPLVAGRTGAITLGTQDISPYDRGSYTGGISGADLAHLGCRYAVVGHAERYRHFGETRATVAAKVAAARRNGITPVLCVGEPRRVPAAEAARHCVEELKGMGDVVVAYEPHWAIGAAEPAPDEHIATVCAALRQHAGTVVYGGSAGPGLLTRLGTAVDGLFLGRFAHDPANLAAVLAEVPA